MIEHATMGTTRCPLDFDSVAGTHRVTVTRSNQATSRRSKQRCGPAGHRGGPPGSHRRDGSRHRPTLLRSAGKNARCGTLWSRHGSPQSGVTKDLGGVENTARIAIEGNRLPILAVDVLFVSPNTGDVQGSCCPISGHRKWVEQTHRKSKQEGQTGCPIVESGSIRGYH